MFIGLEKQLVKRPVQNRSVVECPTEDKTVPYSDVATAAASVALEHGLGGLTFRLVAEHLGTSDRMVVYYLPTKEALVRSAAESLSVELFALLGDAFGNRRRSSAQLLATAWRTLATPEADRIFSVFWEIVGLASRSVLYNELSTSVMQTWLDWLAALTTGNAAEVQQRNALLVMAQLDGLLLLRRTLGPEAADVAAKALLKT